MLDILYLLLSEQLCVHHLDLDRDQSEGLKGQTPSVSVVVLHTIKNKRFFIRFSLSAHCDFDTTDQTQDRRSS